MQYPQPHQSPHTTGGEEYHCQQHQQEFPFPGSPEYYGSPSNPSSPVEGGPPGGFPGGSDQYHLGQSQHLGPYQPGPYSVPPSPVNPLPPSFQQGGLVTPAQSPVIMSPSGTFPRPSPGGHFPPSYGMHHQQQQSPSSHHGLSSGSGYRTGGGSGGPKPQRQSFAHSPLGPKLPQNSTAPSCTGGGGSPATGHGGFGAHPSRGNGPPNALPSTPPVQGGGGGVYGSSLVYSHGYGSQSMDSCCSPYTSLPASPTSGNPREFNYHLGQSQHLGPSHPGNDVLASPGCSLPPPYQPGFTPLSTPTMAQAPQVK